MKSKLSPYDTLSITSNSLSPLLDDSPDSPTALSSHRYSVQWGETFSFSITSPLSSLFLSLHEHKAGEMNSVVLGCGEITLLSISDQKTHTVSVPIYPEVSQKKSMMASFINSFEGEEGEGEAEGEEDKEGEDPLFELNVQLKYAENFTPIFDALKSVEDGQPLHAEEVPSLPSLLFSLII